MQKYTKSRTILPIDQNLTKKIKKDQSCLEKRKGSPTFAEKKGVEQKEWITTEQMLHALKNDPDNEQEYSLNLGGKVLRSTHWFVYDLEKRMFVHTRDWPYDWFSETEILEYYSGCEWCRT